MPYTANGSFDTYCLSVWLPAKWLALDDRYRPPFRLVRDTNFRVRSLKCISRTSTSDSIVDKNICHRHCRGVDEIRWRHSSRTRAFGSRLYGGAQDVKEICVKVSMIDRFTGVTPRNPTCSRRQSWLLPEYIQSVEDNGNPLRVKPILCPCFEQTMKLSL